MVDTPYCCEIIFKEKNISLNFFCDFLFLIEMAFDYKRNAQVYGNFFCILILHLI